MRIQHQVPNADVIAATLKSNKWLSVVMHGLYAEIQVSWKVKLVTS